MKKPSNPSGQSIYTLVRKQINDYVFNQTIMSKYVQWSQYETIETIDAYLNSKHISGETDSLGRDKPFFNIVTAAANIWYRATDIDTKDISITPVKSSQTVAAFLANVKLKEWMKRENFGMFLNQWGLSLARYGSSVVKFVEKPDPKTGKLRLHVNILPWNRLVTDTVSFDSAPIIEKLYYTPGQLRRQKGYDQKQVEALLNALTTRKELNNQQKDIKAQFIEIYEVHGEMPLSMITKDAKDDTTFVQQMQVISYVAKNVQTDGKTTYEDFVLAAGREDKPVDMITHLIETDGRTLSIGAVEHLFQAQWMTNHSAKAIKDQLDLASKLIFQTADPEFAGLNALAAIETGDILTHNGSPITQVANNSHDITSLQSFSNQWQLLAKEITNTPNSIDGTIAPSGTAYRSVQISNQESHSLFEIMTESKGLHLQDMLRTYIIPFIIKTELNNSDEIVATLTDYEISQIDPIYINSEVIRRANDHVRSQFYNNAHDQQITPPDHDAIRAQVQSELAQQGNKRYFKPSDISEKQWKDIFADLEWQVEINITGEDQNKQEMLTTLSTVLQTIATNPAVLQDPNAKLLFNKIVSMTGDISPLELMPAQAPQQQNNTPAPKPPIEAINYKDLSPDLQAQMAKQAGLQPNPPAPATPGITPSNLPLGNPKAPANQPIGAT